MSMTSCRDEIQGRDRDIILVKYMISILILINVVNLD